MQREMTMTILKLHRVFNLQSSCLFCAYSFLYPRAPYERLCVVYRESFSIVTRTIRNLVCFRKIGES